MFTTTLETQYWFGVPRNVSFAGLSMDMDYLSRQAVDKQNDTQNWVNYNRSTGARYSAMEHLVPEQMFSTETAPAEGVSAVKAIALASAEGQRIYTITADNVESALAAINIGPDTETEIRNAAYAGMQITTHQYQINFNGWIGEGYIIIDPETGAGAYKIAGGGNGGVIFLTQVLGVLAQVLGVILLVAFMLALPFLIVSSALLMVVYFQAILTVLAILASIDFFWILYRVTRDCDSVNAIAIIMAMVTFEVLIKIPKFKNWVYALIYGTTKATQPSGC